MVLSKISIRWPRSRWRICCTLAMALLAAMDQS
jgi:hypothetical protein